MTQPSFVPIAQEDEVRPALRLQVPRPWFARRPGESKGPAPLGGRGRGSPGPDQGFALRLARRLEPRLRLAAGESAEDVMLGCALVATRRAALAGRAPSMPDLAAAFTLFGYLDDAPPDAVAVRRRLFRSLSHDYSAQRRLVDAVPDELLRLTAEEIEADPGARAEVLGLGGEQG